MKEKRDAETLDPEALRKIILSQWADIQRTKKKATRKPRKAKAAG